MKTKNELREEFIFLYELAKQNGKCTNQESLGKYIDKGKGTISGVLNGKEANITEPLVNTLRKRLIDDGVIIPTPHISGGISESPNANSGTLVGIPAQTHREIIKDIRESVDTIVSEMRDQRLMYKDIIDQLLGKIDK